MDQLAPCVCSARAIALAVGFLISCAGDGQPEVPPRMAVNIVEVSAIGANRYRLTAEIANFDPELTFEGRVTLSAGAGALAPIPVEAINSSRVEVETPALDVLTTYSATIALFGSIGGMDTRLFDDHSWMTGPPEISMVTSVVGDAGLLKVTGTDLCTLPSLWLAVTPEPGAPATRVDLTMIEGDDTYRIGRVPVLLSLPPEVPRTFTGAVPPLAVHLSGSRSNGAEADAVVGTVQLKYRATPPVPAMGLAGSDFTLKLLHPARAPDLLGLTVYFDDVALAPLAVSELADLTVGGWIYLTSAKFRVPANATPGPHQINVVSSYGEEFLNNNPAFEVIVTTAAR